MKGFQQILEECLTGLSSGTATLDECLALYSDHAEQLRPLLQTAFFLNRERDVMPLPTFSAFARSALIQYALSHPRRQPRGLALSWRTAMTLAMLVVALLVTGTAYAQSALPGDIDYGWKRTSELVWHVLAPDPVAADIILAERRLNEWIAVANDPALNTSARNSYRDALSRLESPRDVETFALIVPVLKSHQQMLKNAGLPTSELDNYLTEMLTPVVIPVIEVPPVATDVPTEIAPKNCASNCGDNQGGTSAEDEKKDKDEKDKDKKDKKDKKDHNGDGHKDNGKGPK
jgi:hypothetical protein